MKIISTRLMLIHSVVCTLAVGTVALVPSSMTGADDSGTPGAARIDILSRVRVTDDHDNVKPFVVARPQCGAYLAWAEKRGERTAILFARSSDSKTFDAPIRISAEGMDLDLGAESGPNVAVGPAGEIYIVWAAGSWAASKARATTGGQDATKQKSTPRAAGHSGHTGHGKGGAPMRPGNLNIWLAKSNDDGQTFSKPIKVNDDADGPEHRFPTAATDGHGNVFVAWLDKRMTNDERPNYCRVFVTVSNDGGKTFARNVDATGGQPNSICHCCRIGLAVSSQGVFAAFRNEIDDVRDTFLVHSPNSLAEFSSPAAIEDTGWQIPMCPFNGPSLALDDAANLHAAWATGGEIEIEPAVNEPTRTGHTILYRRRDANSGTWRQPLVLARGQHVKLVLGPGGVPLVAWENDGFVHIACLRDNVLARPIAANASFPSLALAADGTLLVAWQERAADERSQIHIAKLRLNASVNNVGGGLFPTSRKQPNADDFMSAEDYLQPNRLWPTIR
jgi:hypothetical protein